MADNMILIPDLGGVDEVTVLEVFIKPGDSVEVDQPICTLESDKASMEVPAEVAGEVATVCIEVGMKVKEGMPLYALVAAKGSEMTASVPEQEISPSVNPLVQDKTVTKAPVVSANVYAGPSVRRLAHALDIVLEEVNASGPRGRLLREDLYQHIRQAMQSDAVVDPFPLGDPSKFGDTSVRELSKIKQATATHMRRCWQHIPHVTQHDRVDITELEQFRQLCKPVLMEQGVRLTMLAFIFKALADMMSEHPHMNASYDMKNRQLVLKHYCHFGVAVDTPGGLVVPVLKDVDTLSVRDIAHGLQTMSERARQGDLMPKDLSGGSFTITSLGGIGGDYFTPIVNGPEVAILGVSKASMQPVWCDGEFVPRLMLPLSLSYDHRVVDGAEAARFITALGKKLSTMQENTLITGLGEAS